MSSSDEHEEESDPTPSSDINLEQDAPWKENQRQRMKDLFHVNWFLLYSFFKYNSWKTKQN